MNTDRISVAMATYNGERFLRDQLDSLYNQTRLPDEVVVSDDCSEDGTVGILEEYHRKYGLKYTVNDTREGVNRNFEKAIRGCTGDYIIISDQDDIWFPEKIEASYCKLKEIEGDGPALVSSQCYHIDAAGNIISKHTKIKRDTYSCSDTILQPPGVTQGCSLMFNSKLQVCLKTFPSSEVCMYDAYIGFVCAFIGVKYNMARPLMYHRHHNGNVTSPLRTGKPVRPYLSFVKQIVSPKILPENRKACLVLIQNDYDALLNHESRRVYDKALQYYEADSFVKRIVCIINMDGLSVRSRCELVLGVIKKKCCH